MFFTGLLIMLVGLLAVYISFTGSPSVLARIKPKSVGPSLSLPGKALVKEYNRIPKESRPFDDITSIVAAMDEKTEIYALERRRHFDSNWLSNIKVQNGPFQIDWKKCGYRSACRFGEYHRLYRTIQEVIDSVNEKNQAVLMSKYENNDMFAELETRLREEANLNKHFVKEFKRLG